jgi:hypothetical protein
VPPTAAEKVSVKCLVRLTHKHGNPRSERKQGVSLSLAYGKIRSKIGLGDFSTTTNFV